MGSADSFRPNSRILKGRDLITVGIFTALYFAVSFVRMLLSGLHPHLWVFMLGGEGLPIPRLTRLHAAKPHPIGVLLLPRRHPIGFLERSGELARVCVAHIRCCFRHLRALCELRCRLFHSASSEVGRDRAAICAGEVLVE